MAQPTVSVIMPVYGVEKYLEQSVRSVLAQTFSDFEVLLIDDRSPDGSPALCDRLTAEDPRIRVIHKPQNEGLGMARNTGYDAACGEYILYLDSDDHIEPDLLETALSAIGDADIAAFGVKRVYEKADGSVDWIEELRAEPMEGAGCEAFFALSRARIFNFAWNKLYRKRFLDACGTRFEATKLIEDFLFNIDVFAKAARIVVLDRPLYNYRKPAHETLVSAYAPEFFALCKRKYTLERAFLELTGGVTEENLQFIYTSYVKHLISVFLRNRSEKAALSAKEQRAKIREALSDPVTEAVLADYRPSGFKFKLLCGLLARKRVGLCYIMTALADFVQNKLKKWFKKVLSK